jgi:hypothetical protein
MHARRMVLIGLAAVAAVALLAPGSAAGGVNGATAPGGGIPLPVDGEWHAFDWGSDGYSAVFTFTTAGTARLRVTDAYCRGDIFEIYDNSVLVGRTSDVPLDPECDDRPIGWKPGGAFRDPTYSHGVFLLGGGEHQLQLLETVNYFGGGAGYLGVADRP